MSTLERAIAIAAEAHAGQSDKAGAPYILHPLRVMLSVATLGEKVVAVLHDVLEDCPAWTLQRLRTEGFAEDILRGLSSVTKQEGEDYESFVCRASRNALGRAVKIADLRDNMDLSRISHPTADDYQRLDRYRTAIAWLLANGPV